MSNKKYISLTRLSEFLDNLKNMFLFKTDYIVDEELSATSTNPVQNKIIDAEFEAVSTAMNALEASIDSKSDSTHNHDDRYYTKTEVNVEIDEINVNIAEKADSIHNHVVGDINGLKEELDLKVPIGRAINGKALTTDITLSASDIGADPVNSASSALENAKEYANSLANTKANIVHAHNDMYYTESEIDAKISEINELSASTYETIVDSESKLAEAKSYADKVKNDLLNGAGDAYDTLKELGDLINDNTDAIDALEIVASGKADKVHIHAISDVTSLQTTLDTIDQNILQKSQVQIITWEADD